MNLTNKEILIIGGTGSLGKAITNRILNNYEIKGIRIYSRDEYKQWVMKDEIDSYSPGSPISFLIGDVRDCRRLRRSMEVVDIVINCAAMKQVPSCEYNPIEAIKTNIYGAENIIDCAIDCGVKKVMHVSTDKAVHPINLYGATKTVAEKLFTHANVYSPFKTRFSCCRYGNVLGSRGSIVPLFREKAKDRIIPITHFDMTRFWITLQEVSKFILDSIKISEGGEIFIPKMKSMKIIDLADVIGPDSKKVAIGVRQGEKLHETLITEEESLRCVDHEDKYILYPLSEVSFNEKSFSYTSLNNKEILSKEELKKLLEVIK